MLAGAPDAVPGQRKRLQTPEPVFAMDGSVRRCGPGWVVWDTRI